MTTVLPARPRGERPRYFEETAIDKVLGIVLALAGEVAVLRDRLDTAERLAAQGMPATRANIEAFAPDEAVRTERDAWRDGFLDVVLRPIHQEREALAAAAHEAGYDEAVRTVEAPGEDTRDRVM